MDDTQHIDVYNRGRGSGIVMQREIRLGIVNYSNGLKMTMAERGYR